MKSAKHRDIRSNRLALQLKLTLTAGLCAHIVCAVR